MNKVSTRFAQCSNSQCNSIFTINPLEINNDSPILCPSCNVKMVTEHMIQCKNCQTIIDFLPADPNEEPIVFNAEKCTNCSGTREDEIFITPLNFPDAFI